MKRVIFLIGILLLFTTNMVLAEVRKAVGLVDSRCPTEVSGGVTLDTVQELAEAGVDFITVGALTHSVLALDISLEIADD